VFQCLEYEAQTGALASGAAKAAAHLKQNYRH
jgi:hypothetical protein